MISRCYRKLPRAPKRNEGSAMARMKEIFGLPKLKLSASVNRVALTSPEHINDPICCSRGSGDPVDTFDTHYKDGVHNIQYKLCFKGLLKNTLNSMVVVVMIIRVFGIIKQMPLKKIKKKNGIIGRNNSRPPLM